MVVNVETVCVYGVYRGGSMLIVDTDTDHFFLVSIIFFPILRKFFFISRNFHLFDTRYQSHTESAQMVLGIRLSVNGRWMINAD